MRIEAANYTEGSQIDPYEELLSVDWNASEHESIASKLCLLRLFHAKKLHEHGHSERANEELKEAKQQIYINTGKLIEVYNARYDLLSSMTEGSIHPLPTAEARMQQHRDFARRAALLGDRTIQRQQLNSMMEDAHEFVERVNSGSSTLVAHMVFREAILENLSFAAGTHPHPCTAAHSLSQLAVYQFLHSKLELLHHLARFFERWPNFDVPLHLLEMLDMKYNLTKMIDGDAIATPIVPECKKALSNMPNIRRAQNGTLEALNDEGDLQLHRYSYENTDGPSGTALYVTKLLIRWTRHEILNGMPESQAREVLCVENYFKDWLDSIDPLCAVTQIFGRDEPTERTKWKPWLDNLIRLLTDSQKSSSEVHRHKLLLQIYQCRKSSLTNHVLKLQDVPQKDSLELQRQSRDETEEFIQIYQSLSVEAVRNVTLWHMKGDLIHTDYNLITNEDKSGSRTLDDESMARIQERFEEYAAFLGSIPLKKFLFFTSQTLAKICGIRWFRFNTLPITKVLEPLQKADEIFQGVTGQAFVLQSIQAFASQMHVAEEYNASELYNLGVSYAYMALCLAVRKNIQQMKEHTDQQQASDELNQMARVFVQWTQKSKGRAIALAIGLESQVPREVLENAWTSSSKELMMKHDELKKELGSGASILRSIAIYEELESLWTSMESSANSAAVLGMLRGRTTNSDELAWLGAIFEEDVIFVDWIQIPNLSNTSDLAMAIYQKGLLVEVLKIEVKVQEVDKWVSKNLDPPSNRCDDDDDDDGEADRFLPLRERWATDSLRKMDVLLKGLEHFTKPGQILVFCPTKSMNRIPLHALMLDNEVCICRNPVVYIQSLSLLRLCFLDRLVLEEKPDLADRQAVMIDPLANNIQTTAGLSDISKILGTKVTYLDPLSHEPHPTGKTNNHSHPDRKHTFANLTKTASLLHFHGHVVFEPSDPMRHHLQLAPQPFDPEEGDPLPLSPEAKLTVRDIFTLPFQRGAHVTTISCKSARAHVTKVDDHVGIMTAFHGAGASSTISSLWNRFSKLFYDNLKQEQGKFFVEPDWTKKDRKEWARADKFPYLDMARAMQRTIVRIRRDERTGEVLAPYHWAGLVLSGNWAMVKAWMDGKGEEMESEN